MPHFSDTPIYHGRLYFRNKFAVFTTGVKGSRSESGLLNQFKDPNVAIIVSKIAKITQVQNRRHQTWFQLNFHDIPTEFPIDFLCSTILVIDELVRFSGRPTDTI